MWWRILSFITALMTGCATANRPESAQPATLSCERVECLKEIYSAVHRLSNTPSDSGLASEITPGEDVVSYPITPWDGLACDAKGFTLFVNSVSSTAWLAESGGLDGQSRMFGPWPAEHPHVAELLWQLARAEAVRSAEQ